MAPDVLPAWFPHPRYNRLVTGGAGLMSEFDIIPPQVRMIAFHLSTGINTRANLASPALRGPAVIKDIQFNMGGDPSAVTAMSFSLFASVSPAVTGNGLAFGVIPPGVNILDLAYTNSTGFARPIMDGFVSLGEAQSWRPQIKIGRVITDQLFYINFSLVMTGGTNSRSGVVRVYEKIDPTMVAALIAA